MCSDHYEVQIQLIIHACMSALLVTLLRPISIHVTFKLHVSFISYSLKAYIHSRDLQVTSSSLEVMWQRLTIVINWLWEVSVTELTVSHYSLLTAGSTVKKMTKIQWGQ